MLQDSGQTKPSMTHQVLDECVVVVIAILTATDCTFTLYLMMYMFFILFYFI